MHTEKEAKKLWCPMSRMALTPDSQLVSNGNCIASSCAMWRWSFDNPTDPRNRNPRIGFCGIGGKP